MYVVCVSIGPIVFHILLSSAFPQMGWCVCMCGVCGVCGPCVCVWCWLSCVIFPYTDMEWITTEGSHSVDIGQPFFHMPSYPEEKCGGV